MTIRLLRTLVAVANTRTFSEAAAQVHVTHAAVSQQMQTLEADLGVTLFNRATRTPKLTPLGRQIVAKAKEVIAAYDNIVPSALSHGGLSGTLLLGAMPTTLTGLTPRAMAVLKAQFPQIGLHIRPGLTGALMADVARGTLDAAIISKPTLVPTGLRFRALADEEMHLIAGRSERESTATKLLQTRPFIRFNRHAVMGTLVDTWLRAKRIEVQDSMELDSPEAIISMVHENLGVSIVPELAVPPPGSPRVKQLSLGADAPVRTVGLIQSDAPIKTEALDAVHAALVQVIRAAKNPENAGPNAD